MAIDEDAETMLGPIEARIEFTSKGYTEFHWIEWPSVHFPGQVFQIGWPMNTRPIPQGNQSNGKTMWAYSDRVH